MTPGGVRIVTTPQGVTLEADPDCTPLTAETAEALEQLADLIRHLPPPPAPASADDGRAGGGGGAA